MGQTDKQIEIFRKMTAEQKLEIAMELFYTARELKAGWLRKKHPDFSNQQIEKAVTQIS